MMTGRLKLQRQWVLQLQRFRPRKILLVGTSRTSTNGYFGVATFVTAFLDAADPRVGILVVNELTRFASAVAPLNGDKYFEEAANRSGSTFRITLRQLSAEEFDAILAAARHVTKELLVEEDFYGRVTDRATAANALRLYDHRCAFTTQFLNPLDPREAVIGLVASPGSTTQVIPACREAIDAFMKGHIAFGLDYGFVIAKAHIDRKLERALNEDGRLRLPSNANAWPDIELLLIHRAVRL
jgi:hypothetical protein